MRITMTPSNTPHRISDYAPRNLSEIADTEVLITKAAFKDTAGSFGPMIVSTIWLSDGRVYKTGSGAVAEALQAVPAEAFPVRATFVSKESQNDPTVSYWTVS